MMTSRGVLKMIGNEWQVGFFNGTRYTYYPIYPEDTKELNRKTSLHRDGDEVYFELIDEFTHPELYMDVGWGDGTIYAKL
jgi:hypothetical protein